MQSQICDFWYSKISKWSRAGSGRKVLLVNRDVKDNLTDSEAIRKQKNASRQQGRKGKPNGSDAIPNHWLLLVQNRQSGVGPYPAEKCLIRLGNLMQKSSYLHMLR